ncbi:class III extradiol ring-cleavage dioxygenase [Kangiella sp.]|uniref:DODA-type extradiol aromatic ring-opening family dioxygenase n=1 Tax=Kangiella sp. TaxID=1920245 RepID=UPI0019BB1C5A|nr:class III extradiol ring-cleavage dioxygenase [Kangiella sp.]MBD3652872.1 dioxygenase [Kangiella sp.]
MTEQKAKIAFLSHGGGPLPLLGDPAHQEMVTNLQSLAEELPKPEAIVVFSAHWEESEVSIVSSAKPSLYYDYYGFPEESYHIQYPVAGNPQLASKIQSLLAPKKIACHMEDNRGLDHGVFVPLKIMYPEADIPTIQVSLLNGLDPEEHLKLGRALRSLLSENILIIGSGFSFHNLKAFFGASDQQSRLLNESFDQWLTETCMSASLHEFERAERLLEWKNAPGAMYCHPREEHLIPLHICYGLAQRAADKRLSFEVMGKKASCFVWG